MQTEEFAYEKLILYAYPQLLTLAESSERSAENKALLSFRSYEAADVIACRIVEELKTAGELRILHAELKEMLPLFTDEERFLLEYKYFRRKKVLKQFGGVTLACSERSYFRRQRALIEKVSRILKARGITEENFHLRFGAYEPFTRILLALKEGRERAVLAKRKRREVSFQNSVTSSPRGETLPRRSSTETATATAHTMTIATICPAESAPSRPDAADASGGSSTSR